MLAINYEVLIVDYIINQVVVWANREFETRLFNSSDHNQSTNEVEQSTDITEMANKNFKTHYRIWLITEQSIDDNDQSTDTEMDGLTELTGQDNVQIYSGAVD